MAKTKNKRKVTEKSDPQESEAKTNKEHKDMMKESSETSESGGQDQSGSEKKKQKKELQSDQQLMDEPHKAVQLEECRDGSADIAQTNKSGNKQKKKRKTKAIEVPNDESEQNSGEDKGNKVFDFSKTLTARVTRVGGQVGLEIKRSGDDSSATTINLTVDEWKSLVDTAPKIDKIIKDEEE